ncbi:MAG: putative transcriptional regulator, Crp/Fnr family [Flavipsychrobacter sp.]|nr:putative transcriptional regulator, Crp/Fnr family [Flavipsychrobacter sp.]
MNEAAVLQLRNAISHFVKMDDADWALLLPYLEERQLSKQELFAKEGKVSLDIGFLLNGNMRHYYTRDGEEKTKYFYFEGHFVSSYISCIRQQPSELTIEAMTDCTLLVFRYKDLLKLYDLSHKWERFGRLVAEYLAIGLEERMTGLLMLSPEERYIQLLESNKQKIIERIPQHYVSSYLGITPVSLSRIRNRMAKK